MGQTILGEEGKDQQDNFRDESSETRGSRSLTLQTGARGLRGGKISVPCSMWLPLKIKAPDSWSGVFVSHSEVLRLYSCSLSFLGMGREGGILELTAPSSC